MSTTEPKAGEWWWVERRYETIPARKLDGLGWYVFGAPDRLCNVHPIARIPDPPAPEPTEAEKIDARRVHAIKWLLAEADAHTVKQVVREIRASDEAAGYVLVPTSGPGFERMVDDLMDGVLKDCGGRVWDMTAADLSAPLRAALEAAKGEGQ